MLAAAIALAGCASGSGTGASPTAEAGSAAPSTATAAPAEPSASKEAAEAITLTPISEAERRAIYDDADLNALNGAAGLAYSPQEALIAFDDDPKCGYTLDNISLVRDTITLELSANGPQASGPGADAALVSFRANVPAPSQSECQQRPGLHLSFYKLALRDPLFIPGQSYPITMRLQGENHTDELVWKDAKK